jgi:hypothetical protein
MPGPAGSWPGAAAREERSTTNAAAAFSRTASMPSTTSLIVVNLGETATTVPSPAVNRKRNDPSASWMISNVPATAVVSPAQASLPRPNASRSVIRPTSRVAVHPSQKDAAASECARSSRLKPPCPHRAAAIPYSDQEASDRSLIDGRRLVVRELEGEDTGHVHVEPQLHSLPDKLGHCALVP